MKVLFIGHYHEPSGWGQCGRDYVLAMDSVGIDLVCRPVKINRNSVKLPERIIELENRNLRGVDVVIQNVLPQYMSYDGRFKNVALHIDEVERLVQDSTTRKLKSMDYVIVPNYDLKHWISYFDIDSSVVPLPFDTSRLMCSIDDFEFDKSDFCFYTIADLHRRKNLVGLIQAFNLAFSRHQPVKLVIKTSSEHMSKEEVASHVYNIAQKAVEALGLQKNYHMPIVITDRLSPTQIDAFHNKMDCFVLPSYGEAWSLPAFSAMAFGKMPIVTKSGGPKDFISDHVDGYLVEGKQVPIIGVSNSYHQIYNGRNLWTQTDLTAVISMMQLAYDKLTHESSNKELTKQITMHKIHKHYSYKAVGQLIKDVLCQLK